MRRYIFNGSLKKLPTQQYDVLIFGSGIAGLYSALHIDPDKKCAVITKAEMDGSNSWYAQGGIAAVIAPDDKFESHIEDTLVAGAGLCDTEAVKVLVSEGPNDIRELVAMNVPFDVNPEGEMQITREGGHHHRRIVHCGGDATGRETTKRLGQIALERKNLDIKFNTYLVDLLAEDGKIKGAIVVENSEHKVLLSSNIILCTGGVGHMFKYTTNPEGAVGDGIAAAARAGAKVVNMEMIQFHPTTMIPHTNSERLFLISEAVRGEGGILKTLDGKPFMKGAHPLADLAPRDIVTRAILRELSENGDPNVLLDVSSMSEEFFSQRFPTIFKECRDFGINVPADPIPVRPAQHYLMGGIKTDLNGMTNIEGLYACGETASTGIHGANRLASNSILECLVFGRRAAMHINANYRTPPADYELQNETHSLKLSKERVAKITESIRTILTENLAAVRTSTGMRLAAEAIAEFAEETKELAAENQSEYTLLNMLQNADKIISDAMSRKESVGAHYVVG